MLHRFWKDIVENFHFFVCMLFKFDNADGDALNSII